MNVLAISGSLRAQSSNTEMLRAAAMLAEPPVIVTLFDGLAGLPPFNPDLDGVGAELPPSVRAFRGRVAEADAILISSPEYAHGVPGALKNALDWLVNGSEIISKPAGLLNPSPRSIHAQASLLETLRTMSVAVVEAAVLALPVSGRGLSATGIVADPQLAGTERTAFAALAAAVPESRRRREAIASSD